MAGRFLAKGVAWKKAAYTVLAESNYVGPAPASKREDGIFCNRGQSSSRVSSVFTTANFKNTFGSQTLKKLHNCSIAAENPAKFSTKTNNGNILQTLVDHGKAPLLGQTGLVTFSNFKGNSTRFYSTSDADKDSSENKKTDSPKVSIISSMFSEEPKLQQAKEIEDPVGEEKTDKEEKTEDEKTESPFLRSQRYAKWMLIGTFAFGTPLIIYEFGPPMRDEQGNPIPDEFSNQPPPIAYTKRAWNEVMSMKKDIVEPSSQRLLPDALEPPYYQPPYTLVIELFDVLLHPVYDQIHGWRFKKRPGIDYFLEHVGPPLYEIVIFTRETGMTAYPLIDSMDPKGYIMYRLFRDAARFKSGFKMGNITKGELPKLDPYYQKDLTYLNRDLRRVIVVDNDKRATELQPSNGISLKPWDGTSTDTELFDLAAFLRTVATNEVDDVRPVLEHYRKYEDPLAAFKLAQVRMQEEQQKLANEMRDNKGKSFLLNSGGGGSGFSTLTNYFRSRN